MIKIRILPWYTLVCRASFVILVALIALLILISQVRAGYTGPARPDKIVCQNVGLIDHTIRHTTPAGWFYSFNRSFSSPIDLPPGWQLAMYDADYATTIQIEMEHKVFTATFDTGNEAWSHWWWLPSHPVGSGVLTATVPITKPSSNLCFHSEPIISTISATPIPDVPSTEPTPFPSTTTILSVTVWISPSVATEPTPSWVPTSLDSEGEFIISETYLPGVRK